jgi:hypothetical protein
VRVQQDGNEILSDGFADNVALIVRGELEEFLAQIVAEWVRHQFDKVTERFTEDHVAMLSDRLIGIAAWLERRCRLEHPLQ